MLASEPAAEAFRQTIELSRQHGLTLWEVVANFALGAIDMLTDSNPTRLKQTHRLATTAGMVAISANTDLFIAFTELMRSGFVAAYPTSHRGMRSCDLGLGGGVIVCRSQVLT